jgi:L-lactate dehydrogenase complex protein LldG
MMNANESVISKVRAALGRRAPLGAPPAPPVIDEPIVRLVHSDFGLLELFARMAQSNQMDPELLYVDQLGERIAAYLGQHGVSRVALPNSSSLLEQTGVPTALRGAGLDVIDWDQTTLDQLYDIDAAVTDVYAAVAETGSLVVRASPQHGRGLSLVPPIHVAVLEPKNFIPDLVDLFQKMAGDGVASSTSIITGPSRTADIEMSLVVGVHGPTIVKTFILQ